MSPARSLIHRLDPPNAGPDFAGLPDYDDRPAKVPTPLFWVAL
jgi:hypothetical protein